MTRTIDLFIKSYFRDFGWLKIALDSITRNVSGFRNIVIIIPEHEAELFKSVFDKKTLNGRAIVVYIKEKNPGYLWQQVCKMEAYMYSDADFIMYWDSDCFAHKKLNVQDLLVDDKPEILYTPYEKVGDAVVWREITESVMGEKVDFEFMRRFPLMYHRSTIAKINFWKPSLETIIMGSNRFSEFNFLGAYAFKYEKDKYRFVNTDDWVYTDPPCTQIWSHATKQSGTDEIHLREYIRALETIMIANGIELPK